LSSKYSTHWVGYKVYITETCDEDLPHLITNVETTAATTQDFDVTKTIHASLKRHDLLPNEHLVDAGFLHAELLADTPEQFGVHLLGPAREDQKHQTRAGKGFAAEAFTIDWETKQVSCPAGKTSHSWTEAVDARGRPVVKVKFSTNDCRPCRGPLTKGIKSYVKQILVTRFW
jgi:transposase